MYDSFDPVVALITQAADDPQVLAIKQTLYRAGADSLVIAALQRAAATRQRTNRRRRRYIFYVRRMSRTRQAARSVTIARAAWVSAVALAVVVITAFSATLGLARSSPLAR